MLDEIGNVIDDATATNGNLEHRGHVVAISLMCALDAVSSYGYRGKRGKHILKFVTNHFPGEYTPYAGEIYRLYRNSLIHSWNLFEPAILPGDDKIAKTGGILSFGLLNFFKALQGATNDYLLALRENAQLQTNTLNRYRELRESART